MKYGGKPTHASCGSSVMLHRNQTAQRYRRPSFLEVLTVSKSHAFVSAIAYVQGEYIEFIKMKNQRRDGKRAGHYQRQHNSEVWLEHKFFFLMGLKPLETHYLYIMCPH